MVTERQATHERLTVDSDLRPRLNLETEQRRREKLDQMIQTVLEAEDK